LATNPPLAQPSITTGEATVVMDGDLQDVPEVIPQFVEKHLQGYDVVYAQRVRRKEPWPLRLCHFVFYRLMASLSDTRLPLDAGDFGLMSRRVVEEVRRMPEHHRYVRGMRSWVGFRQTCIAIERAERHSGKSKYGVSRLMRLAMDGIFAFSIVPIRAAALLGTLAMLASSVHAVYAIYVKLVSRQSPPGFTALLVTVIFLSGMILFFLGMIGEYVGRIYEETKSRPQYIIAHKAGSFTDESQERAAMRHRTGAQGFARRHAVGCNTGRNASGRYPGHRVFVPSSPCQHDAILV
jgi:dolichol-phosphate mannosyltransferase